MEAPSLKDVTSLLRDLVRIPSVNPSFRKAKQSDGIFGEAALGDYVEAWAQREGFAVQRQRVVPGRDNILVRLDPQGSPAGGEYPHLLFEAHMDTVQTDGMTIDPFSGEVRDGRLYGRGATDTKASLAGMMTALKLLAQQPHRPRVTLAATVDEEAMFQGVERLVAEGLDVDAAIVGEPTNLHLVVAHKGCVRFPLTAHGRAAHTSQPEEGVNAIEHMALLITGLRQRSDLAFQGRRHPLVGPPTMTISLIEGGIGINTVPDRCEVRVDRRLIPGETPEGAMDEIRSFVEAVVADHPELRIDVGQPLLNKPPMEVSPGEPIVKAMQEAVARLGVASTIQGVPFGTDASQLVQAGIPTVVFGPGSIQDAHTADESVDLAEVATAARLLAVAALSFR